MLLSRGFPATRRNTRAELTGGHRWLEQAGYIRTAEAAGVFTLLPLGWRVHRTICDIVYREMEREGVLNLQLPILQARSAWEQSGRWETYTQSNTMFVTVERHDGAEFGLAPTAEEMVTLLAAAELQSWRDLPVSLHQIGPKFRDERRPRRGLLRCREFVMSDAYSFDIDEESMRRSYDMFRTIYTRIFEAVGLPDFISVQADSGAIGGAGSSEFMAVHEAGEDVLLTCGSCDFGANEEKAPAVPPAPQDGGEPRPKQEVPTPDIRSVEQLCAFFPDIAPSRMVKTILFSVDEGLDSARVVAVCLRGDLDVQEVKLVNALGAQSVEPASPEQVVAATGAAVGFAGPLRLDPSVPVHVDVSAAGLTNFLCGVNETDVHAIDVNFGVDLPRPEGLVDVVAARAGFACPSCGTGELQESRGIEVGHVFMLQRRYSEALGVSVLDASGTGVVPWMGCYGIGTTRLLQAVAEQCSDAKGLIWPESIAPYRYHIVRVQQSDAARELAASLYERLSPDAIYDDREAAAGVKFTDAEMLGMPWVITVGRDAADGKVEVWRRGTDERPLVHASDVEVFTQG